MATQVRSLQTLQTHVADGVKTIWDFNFAGGYLATAHVKAMVERPDGTTYNPTVILSGPNQLTLIPAIANTHVLTIYRASPDEPMVDFTDGNAITEQSLDLMAKHAVFAAAEAKDWAQMQPTFSNSAVIAQYAADAAAAAISAQSAAAAAGAAIAAAGVAQTAASAADAKAVAADAKAVVADGKAVAAAFSAAQADAKAVAADAKAVTADGKAVAAQATADSGTVRRSSIAALRAYDGPFTTVYVTCYNDPTGPQAGFFTVLPTDTTSADDSGTIIVDVTGRRWYRQFTGQRLDVKWFGAFGNGVADDTVAFQRAINACFARGFDLLVSAGVYMVRESSPGAGYALLNRGVSMIGENMMRSVIAPLATMPNTADYVLLNPLANSDISRLEISNVFVFPDRDGTKRGKRAFYLLFNAVTNLSKLYMYGNVCRPGNDLSMEIANTIVTNPQGVPAYAIVEHNLFYDGVKAFGIGDSNAFRHNFHNTPVGSGRHGLWLYHVDGSGGSSSHSMVYGNAMVCSGAALKVDRGRHVKFVWNNVEQSHGAGSNSACVDLDGIGGTLASTEIKGNHFGVFGTATINKVVRVNGAHNTDIEGNTFLSAFVLTDCINITSSALDTVVGRNAIDLTKFTNPVTDAGTGTTGVLKSATLTGGAAVVGSGYAPLAYYKTKENVVFVTGTVAGTVPNNTVIATLPAGYRPVGILRFVVYGTTGTAGANWLEVAADGTVKFLSASGASATFISLAGINYPTSPMTAGTY